MNTKSKIILGLVGAAAAGVVVGLILAPEKGADVRRKISDTAGDWASHLTDMFANAKGELQNLSNKGSKMAGQGMDKVNNVTESYS
jgi:gas vesicle protein